MKTEVVNNNNNKMTSPRSEYATVKNQEGMLYIETAGSPPPHEEKNAINKIKEKYDSYGIVIKDVANLTINEQDIEIEKEKNAGHFDDDSEGGEEEGDEKEEEEVGGVQEDLSCFVTEKDIEQVETFFRSNKTFVYVCPTLANLYMTPVGDQSWQLAYTGIPVLLLDTGESRARTKRKIKIHLAEKGSGFMLWHDTIDNLSDYKAYDTNFHTMYLSSDHRKLAGLSFDDTNAARDFYEHVEKLTSDPANISLSGPSTKHNKKVKRKVERVKLPKKTDISQPCCFQHVTKVDIGDKGRLVSLSTLTPPKKITTKEIVETVETRDMVTVI